MIATVYSLLLRLLVPVYLLHWWRRGRTEPLYRHAIRERFGLYADETAPGAVWVHAVSLGETLAAAALIDALRRERPGMRLLLTHGTATGRETGARLLQPGDLQAWLPIDTPGATRRFFAHFKPALGVLMETEVWPNLLHAAEASRVPMVLASARLSSRSFERGRRYASLIRPAARSLRLVMAQSEADAQRLRDSGAAPVEVDGNLKYDLTPDAAQLGLGATWRAALGRDVVLAAITRDGEEAALIAAWLQARSRAPGANAQAVAGRRGAPLLLIVPRHPQRFDEVAALVRAAGLTLARRSSWQHSPPREAMLADVWLGDSMREMALYYGLARIALLGGSFAPLGGHNLIEAAACGCPLLMGPNTFNFSEAAERSLAAGASLRVANMAAAVDEALALLKSPERLGTLARAALGFAAQHRGAAARMAHRIAPLMRAPGFTLIEMMAVVAVIAILAMIAVPGIQDRLVREQIVEAVKLADVAKTPVAMGWQVAHVLPADNAAAGLPPPDLVVSNYVKSLKVEGGAIQVVFGNRAMSAIANKTLSLRPAVVTTAPVVPVAWVCAGAAAPTNMTLYGVDRTDIEKRFLPLNCRP